MGNWNYFSPISGGYLRPYYWINWFWEAYLVEIPRGNSLNESPWKPRACCDSDLAHLPKRACASDTPTDGRASAQERFLGAKGGALGAPSGLGGQMPGDV